MKQALKDARYNYFWILIIMCGVFTMGGIIGLYMWGFWIVALAMIIELFKLAMVMAEDGE